MERIYSSRPGQNNYVRVHGIFAHILMLKPSLRALSKYKESLIRKRKEKLSKRRLLRDLVKEDQIDIFTMKETFEAKLKNIILHSIYPNSFYNVTAKVNLVVSS